MCMLCTQGVACAHTQYSVARRVNRVEHTLTSIILRIDTAVDKLAKFERLKMHHTERITQIIIDVSNVSASLGCARSH